MAPRLPWPRMVLIQLVGGFLAGLFVPLLIFGFAPEWLGVCVVSGLAVLVGGALPPVIGAYVGQQIATRGGRSSGSDVSGVALGAVAGSIVPAVLVWWMFGFTMTAPWWLAAIVAVCSAGAFAIQARAAWNGRAATPAEPLD